MNIYFRRGQGLVEYVLIIGLIMFVSIFAVKGLGKTLSSKMNATNSEMNMAYEDNDAVPSEPNGDPTGGHG